MTVLWTAPCFFSCSVSPQAFNMRTRHAHRDFWLDTLCAHCSLQVAYTIAWTAVSSLLAHYKMVGAHAESQQEAWPLQLTSQRNTRAGVWQADPAATQHCVLPALCAHPAHPVLV